MYNKPSKSPGKTAPINKSPTDILTWSPIITSIILGGIKIPNVPVAQTTPQAKFGLYLFFNIRGTPKIVNNTTAAPIIPVEAASKTPINTIDIASPPLVFPNNLDKSVIRSSAIPDLSIIIPIKINIGNATRTQFAITP